MSTKDISESQEAFETACKAAAKTIKEADILLLATGAGFSADSGLAVYKDIADVAAYHQRDLTYQDLCNPYWIKSDPELFYGFWGSCFNSYRTTDPHNGYKIIKKWKEDFFANKEIKTKIQQLIYERSKGQYVTSISLEDQLASLNLKSDPLLKYPGSFFVYTSNVDNHSITAGFEKNEVYEIHGKKCKEEYWTAPMDYKFEVDSVTMKAKNSVVVHKDKGWNANHPTCIHCDALARPAVLMFSDWGWVDDGVQSRIYTSWKSAVKQVMSENKDLKMAILEIGCGMNVPTVRHQTENWIERLVDPAQCTLIRINPDFPLYEGKLKNANVISIKSKGLEAIKNIDVHMKN